jgi:DNA polymerase III delta prime subunit
MDRKGIAKSAQDKLIEAIATQAIALVKDIPGKVVKNIKDRFRFSLTIPEESETYFAFEDWLFENYEERFKDVTVYNYGKDESTGKKKRSDIEQQRNPYGRREDASDFGFGIGYSQNSGSMTIKVDGSRVVVTKTKTSGNPQAGEKPKQYYTLSGTNKRKIKQLVEDIYEKYNSDHDQIKVFVSDLYGSWNLVKRIKGKPIDGIILNEEIHSKLVSDLEEFEQDKVWYDRLNIPYKRGYLLYGPPGNGKTSLSIAIASKHKRNIYCLDINKLRDDQTLRYAFQNLQANSLLLIEDVDAAFQKRDPAVRETGSGGKRPVHQITFACLLNCLDGVYYKDGLVTLMTTNHLSKLDEALIRPGRMDMRVEINNPTVVEVEAYVSRFYGSKISLSRYVQTLSMAEVQGVCITHKKDMMAAIRELESDAISVRLNDSVELLQLIEGMDRKPEPERATPSLAAMQLVLDLVNNRVADTSSPMGSGAPDEDPDDPDDEDDEDVDESLPTSADSIR